MSTGIIWWQPALWIGIVVACYWAYHRVKTERHYFYSALQSHWPEMKRFWWPSILIGIGLSILTLVSGILLPARWVMWVEIFISIGLLLSFISYRLDIWLLIATMVYAFTAKNDLHTIVIALILCALVSVIGAALLHWLPTSAYSPELLRTHRGKLMSAYRLRQFYFVPLFIFIPGDWLHVHLWLMGSTQHVTVMMMPLIFGFTQLVKRQLPITSRERMITMQIIQATLCLVISSLCWWQPRHLVMWCVLLVIAMLVIWSIFGYFDKRGDLRFNQVPNGIRVIDVLPHTPAAKMDLHIGDVIISCNQVPVTSEEEFYYALQKSPTFCHLRVQDQAGEYRILESAIFNDSPYEIGVVTFK